MAKYDIPFDIAIDYDATDLDGMKFQDVQRSVAALAREARQRVKELKKAEKTLGRSPALASYERWRDESYSARYKNRKQLMQEFADLKEFLDNETSTVLGYENFINDFDQKFDFESTKEDRDAFWGIYQRHKEELMRSEAFYSSDRILTEMKKLIASNSLYDQGEGRRVVPWAKIDEELTKMFQ